VTVNKAKPSSIPSLQDDASEVTRIIWRTIKPGCEGEFEQISRKLVDLAETLPGYLGMEIYPPVPGIQDAYVSVHRYSSLRALREWMSNPERNALIEKAQELIEGDPVIGLLPGKSGSPGDVSTVIAYHVRPAKIHQFSRWRQRILKACRAAPGFKFSESFDTFGENDPIFVAIICFDSAKSHEDWLKSPIRLELLKEVHHYVVDTQIRRLGTGFEGWFGRTLGSQVTPPIKWRQALVILSALYPVISTLKHLLGPIFDVLPYSVAFLVLLTVDVAILTWIIMPQFTRVMGFWLNPKPTHRFLREVGGFAIIIALIGGTVAVNLLVD